MRKPVFAICVRCLESIISISSFYICNFMTLASFCSWTGWSESHLVANPDGPKTGFLMTGLISARYLYIPARSGSSFQYLEEKIMVMSVSDLNMCMPSCVNEVIAIIISFKSMHILPPTPQKSKDNNAAIAHKSQSLKPTNRKNSNKCPCSNKCPLPNLDLKNVHFLDNFWKNTSL